MKSGGGGKKKRKNRTPSAPVVPEEVNVSGYQNLPQYRELDPFMANNQQRLAEQLSAGYGAPQQQYIDRMNEVYSPVRSMGLFEPMQETKKNLKDGNYNWGSTGLLSLDEILGIDALTKPRAKAMGALDDWNSKYGGSSGSGDSSASKTAKKVVDSYKEGNQLVTVYDDGTTSSQWYDKGSIVGDN